MNATGEIVIPRHDRPAILPIVLIPSVITLAVTLLRLIGEINNWSPGLFGREAGGGGSLIGIAWLVPIFGIYFAVRLAGMGYMPRGLGRVFGLVVLALVVDIAITAVPVIMKSPFVMVLAVSGIASVIGIVIAYRAWPMLAQTLLAYGFLARIPVVIISLIAMWQHWGTHYEKAAPEFPQMGLLPTFLWTSVLPQLTLWIAYTVIFGLLFGAFAFVVVRRRSAAPAAV